MSSALARVSTVPTGGLVRGLAAGSAALALTACGAGFQPLTYEERNSSSATEIQVGALEVRELAVEAPEEFAHEVGDTVEVTLFVSNQSGEEDALVEVTTDAASSVELEQEGRPVDEIEVPAGGVAEATVTLADITRELRAGEYVEMMLRFEGNGASEPVLVPIRSQEGTPEREHSENVHSEEEE